MHRLTKEQARRIAVRLRSVYRPEQPKRALDVGRSVFEFDALIRPMSDLGLSLAAAEGRRLELEMR